ncbi:MAG: ribose transport system permease protein [Subtercola sp.]|nr:ribose transport system permease protein [Subtercola sp.]
MTIQKSPAPTGTAVTGGPAPRVSRSWADKAGVSRFSGLYIAVILLVLFSILLPQTFPTFNNLMGIADAQVITAIAAFALLLPMAAGSFDLSVAAMLGFASVSVAYLQSNGVEPVTAIVIVLVIGAIVGAINGFVVLNLGVDSFIATLGMSSILAAFTYWLTGGLQIVDGIAPGFLAIARTKAFGVPLTILYLIVIALILWFVLEFRPFGRHLYAVGGNRTAARLAGLNVNRVTRFSLIIAGFLAALAGVLLTAKLGSGSPDVGAPYLLPAFAAVFLGSTQIKPGRPNVLGTIVAVYLLAIGVKGLQLLGAPTRIDSFFNGVVLIVAVALAVRSRRKN